jgi:hypothetical protein
MVSIPSLWLPILVSSVFVFLASWILHMFLPHHRTDLKRLPHEDEILETLRRLRVPPGDYVAPHAGSPATMKDPEFVARRNKGPVVTMTLTPGGPVDMGTSLGQWFVYIVVVNIIAAYITGHALSAGAHYLQVFRFAGCTAFVGFALALWQDSIWYKRAWSTTIKSTIDGLLYACLTAGTMGWLWPR